MPIIKKKILIVDDDPDIVEVVKMRLSSNNYDVITALSGEEGLQKIADENPNLVLLDIMMPGLDGFGVLAKLRQDIKTAELPVIMFTAKGKSSALIKATNLKATDYIIKPFESADLLAMIKKYA